MTSLLPEQDIRRVADLILQSHRLVVFTGAGVSTESGIPDFRGPGGLWTKYDEDDFSIDRFLASAECRRKQWQVFGEGFLGANAEPNAAHLAVTDLYRLGKLDCVITQNIDNLHQKAGLPDDIVFELHGNMRRAVCLNCGKPFSFDQIAVRLKSGEQIPDCPGCNGILKPDVVMFGEQLPQRTLYEASRRSSDADLFIVIGSTLTVYPAAYMPVYAVRSGAKLVIINLGETPMDREAEVCIQARAGETMAAVLAAVTGTSLQPEQ